MTLENKYAVNLYDDETVEDKPNPEEIASNKIVATILLGNTSVELIKDCEGCGDTLSKPMLVFTDGADDNERDTSIFCNSCAK